MINCTLCKDELKPEEGELVWRGDDCRVIMVNDPELPGFCRVIWNRHVPEMSDLTYGEREHIMSLVFAVEEVIREVMEPDKINLATLGNMVPHIHWHVIPRYKDDVYFPGSPWSTKAREASKKALESRMALAKKLPAMIRDAISQMY
jgi:diadenosine tetraphosphate (Ap4A) HIT family hydrolase